MNSLRRATPVVGLLLLAAVCLTQFTENQEAMAKENAEPQIAHMVFFTLKESSADNRAQLVAACDKYLADHPGVVYYSAGARADDLTRPVNDQTFDVALHVVFQTRADHDRYQTAEKHLQFIKENKDSWKEVRVFDSNVN
jgi:hypothetical protein